MQVREWPRAHPAPVVHEFVDLRPDLVRLAIVLVVFARRAGQQRAVGAHELIELVLVRHRVATVVAGLVRLLRRRPWSLRRSVQADSARGICQVGKGEGGRKMLHEIRRDAMTAATCPSPAVGMSTVTRAGPISLRVVKPDAPRPKPGT